MSEGAVDLKQFALDIQQEVISRSEIEGEEQFREDPFTQIMIDYLSDAGEFDDAEVCTHRAYGLQVNGYAISENDQCLDLLVTIHTNEVPPRTITREEMTTAFKRVNSFFIKSLSGYHHSVDESTGVFDLAQRIYDIADTMTRVRFFLLTDGIVKSDPPKDKDLDDVRASYHVWDMERLFRCVSSGHGRETIEIDFEATIGSAISCLQQPDQNSEYETYLAIFPGKALVELYGRYGPRLLERNVRSFLQARGKINSGIRKTIKQEPQMFLAFNNGLSMTAESVGLVDTQTGSKGIKWARDLQIVNGGQTTASIYHAVKRDRADVSQVFVQAKLTVLKDPSQMDVVVPKISAYANSQNKIQAADLEANNAFHRRIEELSRTIWAPARDGSLRQTRWFYERARGQFQDDLARERTPGRQKDFLTTHPKSQMFTKTDLAKMVCTWDQLPHIVSRGAQTCFTYFTNILESHIKSEGAVDQRYFERLVAKAILFRTAEHIMRDCRYPGYRANLVTYSLARISCDSKARIDLGRIWREQSLGSALESYIELVSRYAWEHITHPPGSGNVTQYCKREDCWVSFLDVEIPIPEDFRKEHEQLATTAKFGSEKLDAASGNRRQEIVAEATAVPSQTWFRLVAWSQEQGLFTGLQRKIISDMALLVGYGKKPTPKQAADVMKLLQDAVHQGFQV